MKSKAKVLNKRKQGNMLHKSCVYVHVCMYVCNIKAKI